MALLIAGLIYFERLMFVIFGRSTKDRNNRPDWGRCEMERDDPLKHSRHKRMPKVWRMGQDAPRAIDSLGDEFRITVFLTNSQADRAEKEAVNTGMGDLQAWCQATLRQTINQLDDDISPFMSVPVIRTRQPSQGPEIIAELDIPDDPAFYTELAGIADDPVTGITEVEQVDLPSPVESLSQAVPPASQANPGSPAAISLIDDAAFATALDQIMTALRSGRSPHEQAVEVVCSRLDRLAGQTAADAELPRSLVRPLYRLAMESQVLITEVHPQLGLNLTVVTHVRRLQAAVGRILDIDR